MSDFYADYEKKLKKQRIRCCIECAVCLCSLIACILGVVNFEGFVEELYLVGVILFAILTSLFFVRFFDFTRLLIN